MEGMLLTFVVAIVVPAEAAVGVAAEILIKGAGEGGIVVQEVAALATEPRPMAPPGAVARLVGRSGARLSGEVRFDPEPGGAVSVSIRLANAPPGNHAVFLHETGDCSSPDATSAGGWFGAPGAATASVGTGPLPGEDRGPPPGYLGFVTVGIDGYGEKELRLRAYSLDNGPRSLVSRAVVVYERAPEFTRGEQPGARQACGVIRMP